MNKKNILLIIILLIIIAGSVIFGISHARFESNVTNQVAYGKIEGNFADFKIEGLYVDGNEILSMSDVPEGYIIDETNSYCYQNSSSVKDESVRLYTNENGEHIFSNISKGNKCIIYFRKLTFADFIINDAPNSGTDNVSNSTWVLTSDHEGEYRYAGKNPDNYISFNGELWRIIGVMPNMTYCTGTYKAANECSTTKTGSLVKIIRNSTFGNIIWDYKQTDVGSSIINYGSNDWSDSQLQLMLNGTTYLKTGYDKNGNQLHTSYSIASNVVKGNGYNYYNATYSYLDGNGTSVYVPSSATTSAYTATSGTVPKKIGSDYIDKIATVKWDLYGTESYTSAAEGSPAAFYNKERNINSTGKVYESTSLVENRPAYWYGKVGLMYLSDYGYATNGGSTYNRTACLGYQMSGWNSESYQTDCAGNSWLLYTGIEGSAPGSSGTYQWTLDPRSGYSGGVFYVASNGRASVNRRVNDPDNAVRPVLYLSADTIYGGEGEGTWDDPYTIE